MNCNNNNNNKINKYLDEYKLLKLMNIGFDKY